jgi:hypothetical protein
MRRAQWPSRLAAGHRRQAAHRGLEGPEHDATLDQVGTCGCILPGSWFFPRSARVISRNLASERLAPLCPERGRQPPWPAEALASAPSSLPRPRALFDAGSCLGR